MAEMSYSPAMPVPVYVNFISSHYCLDYPVDLTVSKKVMSLEGITDINGDNLLISFQQKLDVDGNIIFKLRESGNFFSFHKSRVLLDAAGNPIITLQNKIMSDHHRWRVFRGDSTDERDMLFSVRKSSLVPLKTKFLMFLASNTREKVCDFKIKGKLSNDSCVVYAGKSKNVIGRMKQNNTAQSFLLGRDSFGLSVSPHVDYAFIVSLVAILREIYEDRLQQLEGIGDVISAA